MKRRQTRTTRGRTAAAVTVLTALALVAYATAASTAAPVGRVSIKKQTTTAATPPAAITKKPVNPVKGDARAADEPPSRSAFGRSPAPVALADAPEPRTRTRVIRMEVTAYCACTDCCGPKARGITASGKRVSYNGGKFVAADTDLLPFGTKVAVPGYHGGRPVPVADRGGAIVGRKLDLYFPSHREALEWGRRWVNVKVLDD